MNKVLYLLFFIIISVISQRQNKCPHIDETGNCTIIDSCPILKNLLEKSSNSQTVLAYLQNSVCGYEGKNIKVCCPTKLTSPNDTLPQFGVCNEKNTNLITSSYRNSEFLSNYASTTSKTAITNKCACVLPQCCPSIRELLKKRQGLYLLKNLMESLVCGREGRYPKVVCPLNNNITVFGNGVNNGYLSSDNENYIMRAMYNCIENKNSVENKIELGTSQPINTSTQKINKISTVNSITSIEEQQLGLEKNCGRTITVRDRLVGGEIPNLDDWPWIVALGYTNASKTNNYNRWLCTGSLITDNFVVTAAHCTLGTNIGKLNTVRISDLNLDPKINDGASPQDILIAKIIVHEQYNVERYTNDIALLKLKKSVTFNDHIKPICLPTLSNIISKTFVKYFPTIAGWDSRPSRSN
ncbi:phenoloxidase-activating enzyme-like isoform X2 [Daktulosphaira vitifoliae]|uniref:phenoloxidase-activating enzyme-like isoform X2 n=1 Tax=Daktulosphaira vitifoliae TaxID=58002 RepID=UPI0021A97B7D|nr:phenoloxidase-activating enzyme-like isoform X2 [Daktulosphaira vitifoliae]